MRRTAAGDRQGPNFTIAWLDSPVVIELDSPRTPRLSDPTRRVGALDAANRKPVSVKPDSVLVRNGDRIVTGIVTATDLSGLFRQLAGPFLFIGEIEGHLRNLIHGKGAPRCVRS